MRDAPSPFLKVPPFPGASATSLVTGPAQPPPLNDEQLDALIERARTLKVGGHYWDVADRPVAEARPHGSADAMLVDGFRQGRPARELRSAFREAVLSFDYADPFTGRKMDASDAIELCGFWRRLIDRNRDIAAAFGFAFWKRETVAPLLWPGRELNFPGSADEIAPGSSVAIWRTRTPKRVIDALEAKDVRFVEVEDGFIRSAGLGADCVPPLSIVVDRLGPHFSPSQPSELENLLQTGEFAESQLARARALRLSIVEGGLSKYESDAGAATRRAGARRHILVPGQVEDDRSVIEGGGSVRTNLELLRRVREAAPDAYILYKPHPDVEAGHRIGRMSDADCLGFADEIVRDGSITSLMSMVDEVHVNTSLAGFEALMRGKPVAVYGTPFYSGWGLTQDFGDIPARRTARRTIDELVAAVLLDYPRYLDPVTGLPCPAEVVVDRLINGRTRQTNLIVGLRRVQGRIMRRFRSIVA